MAKSNHGPSILEPATAIRSAKSLKRSAALPDGTSTCARQRGGLEILRNSSPPSNVPGECLVGARSKVIWIRLYDRRGTGPRAGERNSHKKEQKSQERLRLSRSHFRSFAWKHTK